MNFYKKAIILTSFFALIFGKSSSKKDIILVSDVTSNNLINNVLESSITTAIEATMINKWKTKIILREYDLEDTLREQMKAEMMEDVVEGQINLGQLLNANYILTLDFKQDFNGGNLFLTLRNIETGAKIKKKQYHEYYDEDKKYPNVKSQRFQVRVDLMTKELFNSVFYNDNQDSKPLEL